MPPVAAWGGAAKSQRPFGWRWGIDPIPLRYPQPSLLGTIGYFDLQTLESLQQGNFATGLFETFEQVFTARSNQGDDLTRLHLERYSLVLGGAYGIRDNLESGLALPGVTTDAELAKLTAAPAPAPAPLPPPPLPPAERRVERIILQSVHFEFDRSRLTPLGRRVLDEAAQKLQENSSLSVELRGIPTPSARSYTMLGLGKRRAEVVKGYLVLRHQLDAQRMTTLSYGETRPVADNRTKDGRALNRRGAESPRGI
jgi:outer membrane protein OmpA-like peptidoglycan-associated protein